MRVGRRYLLGCKEFITVCLCVTCLPLIKESFEISLLDTKTGRKIRVNPSKSRGHPGPAAPVADRSPGEGNPALNDPARCSRPPLLPSLMHFAPDTEAWVRCLKLCRLGFFYIYTSLNYYLQWVGGNNRTLRCEVICGGIGLRRTIIIWKNLVS